MELTQDGIQVIKNALKTGFYANQSYGDIKDLIDTIEAQQQEIEQLKSQRNIWKIEFFNDPTDWNKLCKSLAAQRNEYQKEIELCKFYLNNHGRGGPKLSDCVRDILFENNKLQQDLVGIRGTLEAIGEVALEASREED